MTIVDQIKERWPLVTMLEHCGIKYRLKGNFHSPFRPDQNPSCAIWKEKECLKDWSTGEVFDSIRVFAAHKGISNSEAIKLLASEMPTQKPINSPKKPQLGDSAIKKLEIPPLHCSSNEMYTLSDRRGLSLMGVEMAAVFLGTLGFATVFGFACWILSDSNKVAEARRLDGGLFPAIGYLQERKSHTLKGSNKKWPIGINPPKIKSLPDWLSVLLVEGGPDYLAACDLLAVAEKDFLPITMLGASTVIDDEALPFFKGRKVLVLGHPDDAGATAAKRWGSQLKSAGANVRATQMDTVDLNDWVKVHGAENILKGLYL
jgi:hypothetical protein